jgi:hypothetical protein
MQGPGIAILLITVGAFNFAVGLITRRRGAPSGTGITLLGAGVAILGLGLWLEASSANTFGRALTVVGSVGCVLAPFMILSERQRTPKA